MTNRLMTTKKAVVLLSGGLDSTTALAMAKATGAECYALSFNYGQRCHAELLAAERIAAAMGANHQIINIDMGTMGGSALTDDSIDVPEDEPEGIPVTYVPARNTVFLSFALGWAEVLEAQEIYIGVSAVDYSGYPDCRPEFIEAFEQMANLATKAAVEGESIKIQTPLMHLSKAETVEAGIALGVDYSLTVSCYQANDDGKACGKCDSCRLRIKGFYEAGRADPTLYF
ncbi:MAG: 7-cyano-7-deazaguanine synthase QueC [Pseudomonadales bacterium]